MARVTVSLPSLLDAVTGGAREVTAEGDRLTGVIDDLLDRMPALRPHLYQENGALREHVLCFVNGTNTRWLEGEDPEVRDGDSVLFMQAVTGG
ncbi:MAG: MoaD/ThiS family protein [Gemmatimonadota bacterium]|nr:MoaD/ThiS family protein [Gemmatimonadota bacterium]